MRALLLQALNINASAFEPANFPLTTAHIQNAQSSDQLMAILSKVLSGIRQIFVIVDTTVFTSDDATIDEQRLRTFSRLGQLVNGLENTQVKILIAHRGPSTDSFSASQTICVDGRRNFHRGKRMPLRSSHVQSRVIPKESLVLTPPPTDDTGESEDEWV
jgi:hypothetical protein